jgi:choline dehydrogenase-like flavoprotein
MQLLKIITFFITLVHVSYLSAEAIADYVVVGVGNAGGLMAKKLSDDKKTSVIALHSGKNFTDSFIIKYAKNTPFSVLSALLGSPLPFDPASLNLPPDVRAEFETLLQLSNNAAQPLYETGGSTPQPNADNREILWAIPLPLAGGTSVNAGAWCRGTNQLYSQWEAIAGPEWSVNRILTIFKLLEHYHGKTTNPAFRGYCGPISVRQDKTSKLAQVFTQAAIKATDTPFVLDYNDPLTPIGVSAQMQLTRKGDNSFYRVSSATAFLNSSVMNSEGKGKKGRKLQVLFESMALRTIWEGNKAVGVEYFQDGQIKQVFARKGVVVCAGLGSSPFLLHSGVGPSSLLTSLGIPVIFDNPNVGQGLADQPNSVVVFASNPNDSAAPKSNGVFSQISWLPAPGGDPLSRQVRITTVDIITGLTAGVIDLNQPKSRGSVSINSSNPLAPPVVDLGVLTNPDDLALFVSAYMTYLKNINIQLQQIDPLYQLVYPDPAILDNPALVADFIRQAVGSNLHYQCHCRMAPLDQGGVVDSHGRVYGVQNLIVADNSVNPQLMDGSPMATAYLVAFNIASFLGH